MKAMGKIRLAGNRLSVGSWSIPFARSPTRSSHESKRSSQNFSSAAATTSKETAPSVDASSIPHIAKSVPSTSKLIELAATITRETEKLDKYIKESGSPVPSFDVDGPLNFPKLEDEIKRAREEVVRATKELGDLVTGPTESVRWMAWDVRFSSQ